MTVLARFMAFVERDGESPGGCWLWKGRLTTDGYAQFKYEGRAQRAHRVAWRLFRGLLRSNWVILHRCDNRPCVNPSHFRVGFQRSNIRDMIRKGRAFWQRETTAVAAQGETA